MKEIYLISEGEYSDYYVHGIFDTFNKACLFAEKRSKETLNKVRVEFYNLNLGNGEIKRSMDYKNGELLK